MLLATSVFLTKIITGANAVWVDCAPETDRLRVYFANHGSHLDFATLWASLPSSARKRTRPIAARDYWGRNAFMRTVAVGMFNSLLISRTTITREDNPIEQMAAAMRAGNSLILFPEGSRSLDGVIAEFKPGLYHLAQKMQEVELVPVYLQNLNRILPKGYLIPIPLISTVVFGAPLKLLEGERKVDFLRRAREAVLNLAPRSAS